MTDTYSENMGGEKLVFLFGDGADPEQFAHSCSINSSSKLDISADVFTGTKANCTDPSKPSRTTRRVKSIDFKFSGEGMADRPSHETLLRAAAAGEVIQGKVVQDVDAGWVLSGGWIIESVSIGGGHREDQPFSISIAAADDVDFE